MRKKGPTVNPVVIVGRAIAKTFWGKAWCDNLESYSDYDNRLPRGCTCVHDGSVMNLQVTPGKLTALVSGSSIYSVAVSIKTVAKKGWKKLTASCLGQIDSIADLLGGAPLGRCQEAAGCSQDRPLARTRTGGRRQTRSRRSRWLQNCPK